MDLVSNRAVKLGLITLAVMVLAILFLTSTGTADGKSITLISDEKGKTDLITGALAGASDGDSILLKGGVFYEEELVIDKEVSIEGDSDVFLASKAVHIIADNVTIRDVFITLTAGVVDIDGDGWTLERVTIQECTGKTCIKTIGTRHGNLLSSTIVGASQDALQVSWAEDLTIRNCYLYAPSVALRMDNVTGLTMDQVKATQSNIGLYLSWSKNVTSKNSVYDTRGWGMLIANSTNVTLTDSLFQSSSGKFNNYGLYLAFGKDVKVDNSTFSSDAAGISLYKSENVTITRNSIFGNIEGVWSMDSTIHLLDNSVFDNHRVHLNTSGGSATVTGNYWGTTSVKTARSMVRGVSDIGPIGLSDSTPDGAPRLLSQIPDVLRSEEDASSDMIYDIGIHFADDTWYSHAYDPLPSKVVFEIIRNSDPINVTIEINEKIDCVVACPEVEGQLRVSTRSNWYGEIELQVRGHDWRGKSVDSNTFRIIFSSNNDRPVILVLDTQKHSVIKLGTDEIKVFGTRVFDDNDTTWIETRLDEGRWERFEGDLVCVHDNSSRSRDLPRCSDKELTFKAPVNLSAGSHKFAFRACDGEFCSDGVQTGTYEVELDYEGREGKVFSPEGAAIALVLLVLIAVMVVAMRIPKGARGESPKKKVEMRPGRGRRSKKQ